MFMRRSAATPTDHRRGGGKIEGYEGPLRGAALSLVGEYENVIPSGGQSRTTHRAERFSPTR